MIPISVQFSKHFLCSLHLFHRCSAQESIYICAVHIQNWWIPFSSSILSYIPLYSPACRGCPFAQFFWPNTKTNQGSSLSFIVAYTPPPALWHLDKATRKRWNQDKDFSIHTLHTPTTTHSSNYRGLFSWFFFSERVSVGDFGTCATTSLVLYNWGLTFRQSCKIKETTKR